MHLLNTKLGKYDFQEAKKKNYQVIKNLFNC